MRGQNVKNKNRIRHKCSCIRVAYSFGPSGEIVQMVSAGKLILYIDARILLEYHEVLQRPKFKFNNDHINTLISFIKHNGQFVSALPLKSPLPDPDDEAFLEVAIAGNVRYLITGNIVHYPSSRSRNMIEKQVFFLDIIGRGEAFSKHRFQVSGFRVALAFSLLTPDT